VTVKTHQNGANLYGVTAFADVLETIIKKLQFYSKYACQYFRKGFWSKEDRSQRVHTGACGGY
jgi:hypothetical protein